MKRAFPAVSYTHLINGDPTIGSLDILAQNIQTIKDGYTPKNNDENGQLIDISKEILKLYDHTNLDIARINYTTTMVGETKSELAKTKVLVEKLEAKIKDAEDHLKNVSDQNIEAVTEMAKDIKNSQKDMQKDYITTVSYTHLDVYKRQRLYHSCSASMV